MRTFKYRLYPTRLHREALMRCLVATRALYNEMLERQTAHYAETGRFLSKYDLITAFKGRGGKDVPATVVQTLADRLDKALRRFLAFRVLGKPCGFPRFKSSNRWHSIALRQYGYGRDACLDDDGRRLRIAAKLGGPVKIKVHRPLEGTPKTCHLVLRADGHWYALLVCEIPEPGIVAGESLAIGLDVGLRHFVADSDGNTVLNPTFYRIAQRTLRRKQRALSRCRRGSHRHRKAARNVAKTHLKITRQRRDFLFKTVKPYAEGYGRIFIEDLNISGMVRNHHLAKSIADASWGEFFDLLTYKAASAGHQVIKVPAHFTSQKCSGCGEIVAKSLSVRTHVCPHCGFVADRDVNAAKNILFAGLEAGAPPSGVNSDIGCCYPRSRRL